jgi:hypothetical protein
VPINGSLLEIDAELFVKVKVELPPGPGTFGAVAVLPLRVNVPELAVLDQVGYAVVV